jgi:hypothetical protein
MFVNHKNSCENYLFKNYNLKSGKAIGILKLRISERGKRNIPLPSFKNEPVGRTNEYTYRSISVDLQQRVDKLR